MPNPTPPHFWKNIRRSTSCWLSTNPPAWVLPMRWESLGLSEDVFLVGFDSNVATVDGLQGGRVDALIVQNPYAMGYLGVESAYKLLSGQGSSLERTVDTSTKNCGSTQPVYHGQPKSAVRF